MQTDSQQEKLLKELNNTYRNLDSLFQLIDEGRLTDREIDLVINYTETISAMFDSIKEN